MTVGSRAGRISQARVPGLRLLAAALALLALTTTAILLGVLGIASADQAGCDIGTYNAGTDECEISGAVTTTGTKNFHHSVRMLAGSSINASGGGITLNVNGAAGLDFTMEQGAVLEANDDIAPAGAEREPDHAQRQRRHGDAARQQDPRREQQQWRQRRAPSRSTSTAT